MTRAAARFVIPVVLVAAGTIAAVSVSPSDSRGTEAPAPLIRPVRATDRPPPVAVPEVPDDLARPPAITAELETRVERRGAAAVAQRRTVLRTADRVLIRFDEAAPDWLFVRNPVDPRRVSATMIDHQERLLVTYDESDLSAGGLGRGWADVASLGVEPEVLARARPTGRSRTAHGVRFDERRHEPSGSELWWSAETGLPLRVVFDERGARTEILLRRVSHGADAELLRDPRGRFPAYASIDVTDLREKHR